MPEGKIASTPSRPASMMIFATSVGKSGSVTLGAIAGSGEGGWRWAAAARAALTERRARRRQASRRAG
jgi:hypothetical protein